MGILIKSTAVEESTQQSRDQVCSALYSNHTNPFVGVPQHGIECMCSVCVVTSSESWNQHDKHHCLLCSVVEISYGTVIQQRAGSFNPPSSDDPEHDAFFKLAESTSTAPNITTKGLNTKRPFRNLLFDRGWLHISSVLGIVRANARPYGTFNEP